jgi:hypothetical protein
MPGVGNVSPDEGIAFALLFHCYNCSYPLLKDELIQN